MQQDAAASVRESGHRYVPKFQRAISPHWRSCKVVVAVNRIHTIKLTTPKVRRFFFENQTAFFGKSGSHNMHSDFTNPATHIYKPSKNP